MSRITLRMCASPRLPRDQRERSNGDLRPGRLVRRAPRAGRAVAWRAAPARAARGPRWESRARVRARAREPLHRRLRGKRGGGARRLRRPHGHRHGEARRPERRGIRRGALARLHSRCVRQRVTSCSLRPGGRVCAPAPCRRRRSARTDIGRPSQAAAFLPYRLSLSRGPAPGRRAARKAPPPEPIQPASGDRWGPSSSARRWRAFAAETVLPFRLNSASARSRIGMTLTDSTGRSPESLPDP